MNSVGILAYGSLITEPGDEIVKLIARRIKVRTPFPVEYGRISTNRRGGAPTLVPHKSGRRVNAEILVLKQGTTPKKAEYELWSRETGNTRKDEAYHRGTTDNAVQIEQLHDFHGIDIVYYTDFLQGGKVDIPSAEFLAKQALESIKVADIGKDGISYLIDAKSNGVRTRLSIAYEKAILRRSRSDSLQQALTLRQSSRILQIAKQELISHSSATVDANGYVATIKDNLIPGINLAQFQADLNRGAGQELAGKFRAVHSSSALAINSFGIFKDKPDALVLWNDQGFSSPRFEVQMPTGLGGTPPTLDVVVSRGEELIAIESKFLEYLTPKKAKFSTSYSPRVITWAERCWWEVAREATSSQKRQLDVAQLVKHYFGISRLLHRGDRTGWKPKSATLLYLYWEPENASDIAAFQQHCDEITMLLSMVKESQVKFRSLRYSELWEQWESNAVLGRHVRNLKCRYSFRV